MRPHISRLGMLGFLYQSPAFNVPGVKEHAHFLKDIRDARRIRSRVLECERHIMDLINNISPTFAAGFEQAGQPTITDADRRRLLSFCIVGASPPHIMRLPIHTLTLMTGGGPTGVEFAAELHDLLQTEIKKHYPVLFKFARITLFDTAPTILGSFDEGLQQFATKRFKREGINILTQHHVECVEAVSTRASSWQTDMD